MDVIIPHCSESYWESQELRYCLRSIEKNFKDLGNVYIHGYCPPFVKNVIHNPIEYTYESKGARIIAKLLYACNNPNVSSDYLFIADDNCFLKPMGREDIKPYYTYDMKGESLRKGNKLWMQCLRNTRRTLLKEKLPCFNHEPHTPLIINKNAFKKVMAKYDWINTLYPTFSLYFNNILSVHEQLPPDYRVFYDKEGADLNLIEGKSFLAYNDLGLSSKLQFKLADLFPMKSRFEK